MKIHFFRRIISAFAIFFAVGCALDSVDRPPEPERKIPTTYYGPGNEYYYFTSAQVQRKKGNLDKSIVLLRKAIELDPDSSYLQRELATVYLQNKENEKAIEVLKTLLQKNPNDIKSLIIYGGLKQVNKETREAVATYEKILSLDPKQERIYSLLGSLYMQANEFERAKAIFNRQIKNFPESYTGTFSSAEFTSNRIIRKQRRRNSKKPLNWFLIVSNPNLS